MSEENHDWDLILKASVIPALASAAALWKLSLSLAWLVFVLSASITAAMVWHHSKRKADLFSAIVLLASVFLFVLALKRFGLI